MKKEYKTVVEFFGADWFDSNWQEYRQLIAAEDFHSFSTKIVLKRTRITSCTYRCF